MVAGRPRTSSPEKKELIELGEDLIAWASKKSHESEPIRVRFCDWYTDKGFIRSQWENFRIKKEFSWYYERARSLIGLRYIDGTVNQSIAHRYLRMYDPELRDDENQTAKEELDRKKELMEFDAKLKAENGIGTPEEMKNLDSAINLVNYLQAQSARKMDDKSSNADAKS